MTTPPLADRQRRVQDVRRFNRFYTQRIGILHEGHLDSPFSLAAVRVMYELAHRDAPTASELGRDLDLDAGYLSRILRRLHQRGLVEKRASEADGRQSLLRLTPEGSRAFAALSARSSDQVGAMLARLSPPAQHRLLESMRAIEEVLGDARDTGAPLILRPHQPGDMGWIVHRHGVLYAQEYGWDERFEALVASIVARFVERFDAKRERCWMAERDGRIVGSVFLVRHSKTVGQLRLLLVEPEARGLGVGSRLVDECVRFAGVAGYRTITLWTNDVLHAARRIYERAGFVLVKEEPHHSFGHDLVAQTWEMRLRGAGRGARSEGSAIGGQGSGVSAAPR
ncbi:MAG: bifunctional helix-turn-helix transcriptional regulator/GNAT family N-acetyltransferase [Gemmatimonadaceae bacterium]